MSTPRRQPACERTDDELRLAVTLQAASLLLSYPAPESEADLELVHTALRELPAGPVKERLGGFLAWWRGLGSAEREQTYVATFDLGSGPSLYLTEAQPRTSRERGAALFGLRRAYEQAGLDVRRDELPDFLPLVLEAAAHAPSCREVLVAHREALCALAAGLERHQSRFALVVDAVTRVLPREQPASHSRRGPT